jgi:signal transduction histidine kinase
MRERAQQIGASLTLTSSPGVGTTIEVIASRSSAA